MLDAGVKPLPVNLQQQLFLLMAWPDPRKWTGANKQDIAVHHLQRGCLMKDDSIVRFASGQIFYPGSFYESGGFASRLFLSATWKPVVYWGIWRSFCA